VNSVRLTSSAVLLSTDDRCQRASYLSQQWELHIKSPMAALYQAIEAGLQSSSEDAGVAAGDELMTIAVQRGLDTDQSDLLGHATHLASISDMVTWLLRPEKAWQRPADIQLGDITWKSSAFMHGNNGLRRVILVDHWSAERELAESLSWRTMGESAVHDMPMTEYVVVIGPQRDGRRHGPLSKGYVHPVNGDLRLRKRDGESFGPTWGRAFRENAGFSREEWLEVLIEDGCLTDCILTVEVPVPEHAPEIRELAQKKLQRIQNTVELPEPQLSQCFSPIHPCQFKSCCPYWRLPSEKSGFLRLPPEPRPLLP